MPCDPNDNSLNPSILGPPIPVPGFGIPFVGLPFPLPDWQIPDNIPEDILKLLEELFAFMGGVKLVPNLDDAMKTVLGAIASLLNQIAPFLALYHFFQALLNMILCILDVLCALLNPWSTSRAIRRLFKRCLPDFLNLFPWLALIAMILALLYLLYALLIYILELILAYIRDLLANLVALSEAIKYQKEDAIIAVTNKIAYLLCLIEQVFAALIALQAIFNVIRALLNFGARSVCSFNPSGGDPGACCTDDVCPPFIRENPDGFRGIQGTLLYHNKLIADTAFFTTTLREERWQFYDLDDNATYKFKDIITPIEDANGDLNIFWPESTVFTKDSMLKHVPYVIDITLVANPDAFDYPTSVIGGERTFVIKNVIVERKPYIGYDNWTGGRTGSPANGTYRLVGGLVYEEDGTTPFMIGSNQATIETFIHNDTQTVSSFPTNEDGYFIEDSTWLSKHHHEALVKYDLLTFMCIPSLEGEAEVLNQTIIPPDISADDIPDIGTIDPPTGALGCMSQALGRLRQDVSEDNTRLFAAEMTACIAGLQKETEDSYDKILTAGTDRYNSTVTLDPDVQFVGSPIVVSVQLFDGGNQLISANILGPVQESIANKLEGSVTLGQIGKFTYDGYDTFNADITSEIAGNGQLTVSFNNQTFATILGRDDDNAQTSIVETVLDYEFVGVKAISEDEKKARRDEHDVAVDRGGV